MKSEIQRIYLAIRRLMPLWPAYKALKQARSSYAFAKSFKVICLLLLLSSPALACDTDAECCATYGDCDEEEPYILTVDNITDEILDACRKDPNCMDIETF